MKLCGTDKPYHVLVALTALVAAAPTPARAQYSASGVTLVRRIPLTGFPSGQTRGSAVWGYTSPGGTEYAIMGLNRGTAFVDVNDATRNLMFVGSGGVDELWREMKTYGRYCYVVSDGSGVGMQVMDLANIDNGTVSLVNTVTLGNTLFTAHTIYINPASGYAYLCGTNRNAGLLVLNLSNPTNPSVAGTWGDLYVHDVTVLSYTTGPYAGREIAFAFAARNGLRVVDVTNKANMQQLGALQYPGLSYCHQGWLTEDRKYLFINDEFDELNNLAPSSTTYVIDVRDLSNPTFVTSFTNGINCIDHNLLVRGNLLYEANYTSGLRVWDVTDPICPKEIAWFDTYPASDAEGFNGAWGVYALLPNKTIAISDINGGLFLLKVDCNSNGADDGTDVANGTSADDNGNGIPDECDGFVDCNENGVTDRCEPPADCNENGVLDECDLTRLTSADCNANAVPDECDVATDVSFASPELRPFGGNPDSPQVFNLFAPPEPLCDVHLRFRALANLSGGVKHFDVQLNATPLGTVSLIVPNCQAGARTGEMIIPRDVFRAAVGGGNATIIMFADPSVETDCCGTPNCSYIQVTVEYPGIDPALDCNDTLAPDECEGGDLDGDGLRTVSDYGGFPDCATGPCEASPCDPPLYSEPCCTLTDLDGDGDQDLADYALLQRSIEGP